MPSSSNRAALYPGLFGRWSAAFSRNTDDEAVMSADGTRTHAASRRSHIKISPHEKSARREIITDSICIPLIAGP